ncbi:MAG TPA: EAL domain-containing protein, partial [Nevskiaceae bacterium]|nr:EAL domain-containing protein [Nevskiaceae bacterium]
HGAREGLRHARDELTRANASLTQRVDQLHAAEEKLSGILESIDNIVWSVNALSHEMQYVSAAVERVHGRPVSEFQSDPLLWLKVIHVDDRASVRHWLAQLVEQGAATLQYRIVRPGGEVRWLEDRARLVRDAQGQPLRLDGVASDISERKSHEAEMSYLANHDDLTGLPNRNLLNDRVAQALAQARRTGHSLAVMFMDLDGFKFINDSFGHNLGDALLRSVAGRLTQAVREGDTVARLGGDEFVIMLWDIAARDAISAIAGKLLAALSQPLSADGRELHVSASIGISVYPQDGENFETLLKHADVAMYRAKELGRSGYKFYTQEMSAQTDERVEMEAALRQALARDELSLHYQPQVDIKTGGIFGVEALIRWQHPKFGAVPPGRFIRLAEDTGLILPIGEWALRSACAQLQAWRDAGHAALSVAVNISARQFHQQDVPALVRSVCRDTGLPPSRLELELTESTLINNSDAVIETLRELEDMGVVLAMDDFGTGYSSLSYLKRFPIDVIKIDQSFTADVCSDADAASITRAIIAMARSLSIKTVAEGVENAEQLEFMRRTGCDAIQGHWFSRALTAVELGELLDDVRAVSAADYAAIWSSRRMRPPLAA